jgi:acetylornithine/succinyldiaminopimelate/putrescine aminotransferase
MGRTGRWFGFSHENLVPDILVIGKALGGGLPVSAVVTTKEVEERAVSDLGRHVQSHQNTPLSGKIAAEVIGTLRDEGLVERSNEMGEMLLSGLKELQARFPCIREVRGRGLMVGAELTPEAAGRGPDMSKRLLEKGYIQDFHQLTSTFRLFPPFVITRDEIRGFLAAFGEVLAEEK